MADCPYDLDRLGRWNIEYLPSVDSTNRLAKARARENAPHGTLILADTQTDGRGRRGRGWISPPGRNVYMTLIARPADLPAERAAELVYVDAVALARALCDVGGIDVRVKWPNDLVANGKKLAGTLLEMQSSGGKTSWAVIGMGVNVLGRALPEELKHATTLEIECDKAIDRADVVDRFMEFFAELYGAWRAHGTQAVLPMYRSLSATLGRAVRAETPNGTLEGVAADIAADGTLLMELADGSRVNLNAGDVSVRGLMGYV